MMLKHCRKRTTLILMTVGACFLFAAVFIFRFNLYEKNDYATEIFKIGENVIEVSLVGDWKRVSSGFFVNVSRRGNPYYLLVRAQTNLISKNDLKVSANMTDDSVVKTIIPNEELVFESYDYSDSYKYHASVMSGNLNLVYSNKPIAVTFVVNNKSYTRNIILRTNKTWDRNLKIIDTMLSV